MSLLSIFLMDESIQIDPIRRLPHMSDLVTDVSWNYEVNQRIRPLKPKPREADGTYRMQQKDIERIQEFHKCIECFLCQNVCHVVRDQQVKEFAGPRFLIRIASLAMHPLDSLNRLKELKDVFGIGYCYITKCCVLKSVRKISRSLTTQSFHSKNESLEPFTIHWRGCGEA